MNGRLHSNASRTPGGRNHTRYRIILFVATVVLLTSCDLFDPRSPEDPSFSRSSFRPATSWDIVIDNFIGTISERNTQNYIQCFVDPALSDRTFEFLPTQDALRLFAGVFDEWDLRDERSYFENMLSRVPSQAALRLELTTTVLESFQSDSAVYRATYLLTVDHNDEGFPNNAFTGTMRLSLATDRNNTWSIYRWADFKFEDSPSWSDLKVNFVN
jgi:hypothetical protein